MSRQYKIDQVPTVVCTGFQCNRCGEEYKRGDIIEMQEHFHTEWTGGYGSAWGDMCTYSVTLCQKCAHNVLSEYAVLME